MDVKVELGFTQAGIGAPFITLNDSVKGIIGSQDYYIGGGEVFVDVSRWFKSLSLSRGKSRELDRFDSGKLTVVFDNSLRLFDPTYASSPFFGQIVPKRAVRITVDGVIEFTGVVDDWNIAYEPSGNSEAALVASDNFALLANNILTSFSSSEELTGARIEAALDDVAWPSARRDIDAGEETLIATTNSNDNLLAYLTKVESSELGFLFIDKIGDVRFISRNGSFGATVVTLADDGTGVPYTSIQATYGSEFLYNKVTLSNGSATATQEDSFSQALYGALDYELDTLNIDARLSPIAGALLTKYKQPEYRFQNVEVALDTVTALQRADLLAVELGDIVQVKFTPSSIPPAITRLARVIGIEQTINNQENRIAFQLASIEGSPLVISSPAFGIIGTGTIGF